MSVLKKFTKDDFQSLAVCSFVCPFVVAAEVFIFQIESEFGTSVFVVVVTLEIGAILYYGFLKSIFCRIPKFPKIRIVKSTKKD